MIRRINYTDRQKIKLENIEINFIYHKDKIKSFNADIDLSDLKLHLNAKVYVDVYHKSEIKRFDFGTAENPVSGGDTDLEDFAYPDNMKFRILVVDDESDEGRILAYADKIRPQYEPEKRSILPIVFEELGNMIWQIDYSDDEGGPVLKLNKSIPNIENTARRDTLFIMYVYPYVIREIFYNMIFITGISSVTDPEANWVGNWLNFAMKTTGDNELPQFIIKESEEFDAEESLEWINFLSEEFCSRRSEWNEFIEIMSGSK